MTTRVVLQHRFAEAATELAAPGRRRSRHARHGAAQRARRWRPQRLLRRARARRALARDSGGVLVTQAIHSLDLMLSLTGPAAAVQAMGGTSAMHRMEGEDFVGGGIAFANGALGAVMATCHLPSGPRRARSCWRAGVALLDGGQLTRDFLDGRSRTTGEAGGIGRRRLHRRQPEAAQGGHHPTSASALDEGREPRVTAREALRPPADRRPARSAAEGRRRIEIAA
ncbi:MAG: Gfo/Idh/MocA family oxidoreductase [Geminicoccaceae bacterium]